MFLDSLLPELEESISLLNKLLGYSHITVINRDLSPKCQIFSLYHGPFLNIIFFTLNRSCHGEVINSILQKGKLEQEGS